MMRRGLSHRFTRLISFQPFSPRSLSIEIETQKQIKLEKYQEKLLCKAQQQGISLDELKLQKRKELVSKEKSITTESDRNLVQRIQNNASKALERKKSNPSKDVSGIKPLSQILDLEKLESQDSSTISQLWTSYHTMKNKLSAVIPFSTYHSMIQNAQLYPQFILPLPQEEGGGVGYSIYFLQWGFPTSTCSTVLFTSLAEYKLKQDFSQPCLILSLYTDLLSTKQIVLMRGDISQQEGEKGEGKISQKHAQLLSILLQKFYLPNNNNQDQETKQLLHDFKTNSKEFTVDRLIDASFTL